MPAVPSPGPVVPEEPLTQWPGIEEVPADLMEYALVSGVHGQVALIAYLRGKLAGVQEGLRLSKESR